MADLLTRLNARDEAGPDYTSLAHPVYAGPRTAVPLACVTLAGEVFVTEHTADDGPITDPDPTDPANNQVNY